MSLRLLCCFEFPEKLWHITQPALFPLCFFLTLLSLPLFLLPLSPSLTSKIKLSPFVKFTKCSRKEVDNDRRLAAILLRRLHEFITVYPHLLLGDDASFQFSDGRRAQGTYEWRVSLLSALFLLFPQWLVMNSKKRRRARKAKRERIRKSVCLLRGNTDSTWRHKRYKSNVPNPLVLCSYHCTYTFLLATLVLCAFVASLRLWVLFVHAYMVSTEMNVFLPRCDIISKMFTSVVL